MHEDYRARISFHETSERYLTCNRQDQETAEPTDECLYCGEALPEYGQWCDTECKHNWEQSRAHRK
jgi:hypothetical protein